MGFEIFATPGTSDTLRKNSINVNTAYRINEPGHPDALDLMHQGKIQFIINVPTISGGAVRDGNIMRRLAVEMNIPFVTTISGGIMEVAAIEAARKGSLKPIKLQVNYQTIKSSKNKSMASNSSKHVGQA
jgi:carbamoyl-phosphate synthase large subunit